MVNIAKKPSLIINVSAVRVTKQFTKRGLAFYFVLSQTLSDDRRKTFEVSIKEHVVTVKLESVAAAAAAATAETLLLF